mmetsp:Transcript_1692/g.6198  ORF Transcript_1692/g.6198 Transcript_1692/m.6198 type:complete len:200 (+) Transcript_1692:292-891(+)
MVRAREDEAKQLLVETGVAATIAGSLFTARVVMGRNQVVGGVAGAGEKKDGSGAKQTCSERGLKGGKADGRDGRSRAKLNAAAATCDKKALSNFRKLHKHNLIAMRMTSSSPLSDNGRSRRPGRRSGRSGTTSPGLGAHTHDEGARSGGSNDEGCRAGGVASTAVQRRTPAAPAFRVNGHAAPMVGVSGITFENASAAP